MDIQQPNQQPNQQPVNQQQPDQNIQPNPVIVQPPKNIRKIVVLIILGVLILGSASYGAYYWWPKNNKPIVCTQEAKQCPDGSYVSRTGPNCEFALCPNTTPDQTAGWQMYSDPNEGWSINLAPNYEISKNKDSIVFAYKIFNGINIRDLPAETTGFWSLNIKKKQNKPADVSLFKYVQSLSAKSVQYDEYFQTEIQSIKNPQEVEIGGRSIPRAELFVFEGCPIYAYWFEKNTTEYVEIDIAECFQQSGPFGISGLNDGQRLAMKDGVQQILSTFKFTK